jgi:hypothetical protein
MLAWLIAVFVPALSGGKARTTLLLQLATGRIRTMSKALRWRHCGALANILSGLSRIAIGIFTSHKI